MAKNQFYGKDYEERWSNITVDPSWLQDQDAWFGQQIDPKLLEQLTPYLFPSEETEQALLGKPTKVAVDPTAYYKYKDGSIKYLSEIYPEGFYYDYDYQSPVGQFRASDKAKYISGLDAAERKAKAADFSKLFELAPGVNWGALRQTTDEQGNTIYQPWSQEELARYVFSTIGDLSIPASTKGNDKAVNIARYATAMEDKFQELLAEQQERLRLYGPNDPRSVVPLGVDNQRYYSLENYDPTRDNVRHAQQTGAIKAVASMAVGDIIGAIAQGANAASTAKVGGDIASSIDALSKADYAAGVAGLKAASTPTWLGAAKGIGWDALKQSAINKATTGEWDIGSALLGSALPYAGGQLGEWAGKQVGGYLGGPLDDYAALIGGGYGKQLGSVAGRGLADTLSGRDFDWGGTLAGLGVGYGRDALITKGNLPDWADNLLKGIQVGYGGAIGYDLPGKLPTIPIADLGQDSPRDVGAQIVGINPSGGAGTLPGLFGGQRPAQQQARNVPQLPGGMESVIAALLMQNANTQFGGQYG